MQYHEKLPSMQRVNNGFFHMIYMYLNRIQKISLFILANRANTDEMLLSAAFNLDLYCLQVLFTSFQYKNIELFFMLTPFYT